MPWKTNTKLCVFLKSNMMIDANFPDIDAIWKMYLNQEIRDRFIHYRISIKNTTANKRILQALQLNSNCRNGKIIRERIHKLMSTMNIEEASVSIGCSAASLKRICRDVNITRWKYRWYKAQRKRALKQQFASTYHT
jgi:hypothetical protein